MPFNRKFIGLTLALLAFALPVHATDSPAISEAGNGVTACLNRCAVAKQGCASNARQVTRLDPRYAEDARAAILDNCAKVQKGCEARCSSPMPDNMSRPVAR